ncbi:MAG: bifunctional DNA-formamidopyrimidine glycosylase/DNA-(apurinic or apyrimidinic site) lyase [Acidimicrobiaceae bacterium]|nr:bifunctional DNA-formamidopyrimidine glycosylase/DNA-(apurinic or apyrimidinic site) lyase [Acidimicrobiaceae bacterium]
MPEVETVRAGLAREMNGKKIKAAQVSDGRSTRRHPSAREFRAQIEGRSVKSVERLGKYLACALDNGSHLVIHLGMTGQVLRAKNAKAPKPKHTHVVLQLSTNEEVRFADQRTFGEMFVSAPVSDGEVVEISKFARLAIGGSGLGLRARVRELAHLGMDPYEDQVGWDRFTAVTRSRSVPLKALLTDQSIICGIGNIYADEILFSAGLRFDRPCDALTTVEARRLHRTIPEVLTEAIKAGGTTLSDEMFVNVEGEPGTYQNQLQVHTREGLACPQCRTPIERVIFRDRSTYWCPRCQT